MTYNYYYGSQAEQFSFVRIPRMMLTDKAFQSLSITAKVLYGVLLDRMSLSMKNRWFDEENRVYIIYQIGEIMEDLGFTKKKTMDLLQELETFGLLEKKRRGHGLPNILYVKNFMGGADDRGDLFGTSGDDDRECITDAADQDCKDEVSPEEAVDEEMDGSDAPMDVNNVSRGSVFDTSDRTEHYSRSADFGTQEVQKTAPLEVQDSAPLKNQTNNNYTYRSKDSHLILSSDRLVRYDEMRTDQEASRTAKAYEQVILENIDYDSLIVTHERDRDLIDGIVNLILETVLCSQDYVLIASSRLPASVVKSRFLKLNYSHVEYVLECLHRNTTRVNNIKKYLLASLFNAPSTKDSYYQTAVQHDMPELAACR